MRLPPPARRYSPISVIAPTFEHRVAPEFLLQRDEIVAQEIEDFLSVNGGGSAQRVSAFQTLIPGVAIRAAAQLNSFDS